MLRTISAAFEHLAGSVQPERHDVLHKVLTALALGTNHMQIDTVAALSDDPTLLEAQANVKVAAFACADSRMIMAKLFHNSPPGFAIIFKNVGASIERLSNPRMLSQDASDFVGLARKLNVAFYLVGTHGGRTGCGCLGNAKAHYNEPFPKDGTEDQIGAWIMGRRKWELIQQVEKDGVDKYLSNLPEQFRASSHNEAFQQALSIALGDHNYRLVVDEHKRRDESEARAQIGSHLDKLGKLGSNEAYGNCLRAMMESFTQHKERHLKHFRDIRRWCLANEALMLLDAPDQAEDAFVLVSREVLNKGYPSDQYDEFSEHRVLMKRMAHGLVDLRETSNGTSDVSTRRKQHELIEESISLTDGVLPKREVMGLYMDLGGVNTLVRNGNGLLVPLTNNPNLDGILHHDHRHHQHPDGQAARAGAAARVAAAPSALPSGAEAPR